MIVFLLHPNYILHQQHHFVCAGALNGTCGENFHRSAPATSASAFYTTQAHGRIGGCPFDGEVHTDRIVMYLHTPGNFMM